MDDVFCAIEMTPFELLAKPWRGFGPNGREDANGALSPPREAQCTRLKEEEEATNEAEGGEYGRNPQKSEEETGDAGVGASRASTGLETRTWSAKHHSPL